jgi:hypothetical protein
MRPSRSSMKSCFVKNNEEIVFVLASFDYRNRKLKEKWHGDYLLL